MLIREARTSDLPQIVAIHRVAFAGFFMTELGHRFLKAYYRQVLDFPNHLFLVCQNMLDAPIEGFVAGFTNPHEFYNLLKKHKWYLALCALAHLIVRPHRWTHALASLRRAQSLTQPHRESLRIAELASLAVHPQAQGKGIGKALVLAFLELAQEQGVQKVYLTTDASNNEAVNSFYQRLGFRLSHQFWHTPQRLMNEYVYDLYNKQVKSRGEHK